MEECENICDPHWLWRRVGRQMQPLALDWSRGLKGLGHQGVKGAESFALFVLQVEECKAIWSGLEPLS